MSIPLSDALQQVELEAGRVYECRVGNLQIEVRVKTASSLLPDPLNPEDIMLDPWTEFPGPKSGIVLPVTRGGSLLPDPQPIPEDRDS